MGQPILAAAHGHFTIRGRPPTCIDPLKIRRPTKPVLREKSLVGHETRCSEVDTGRITLSDPNRLATAVLSADYVDSVGERIGLPNK